MASFLDLYTGTGSITGAPYTIDSGSFTKNNRLIAGAGNSILRQTTTVFTPNVLAKARINAVSTAIILAVRSDAALANCYLAFASPSSYVVQKSTGGSPSTLFTPSGTPTVGDVFGLQVSTNLAGNTVLLFYLNTGLVGSAFIDSSSPITTAGSAGVALISTSDSIDLLSIDDTPPPFLPLALTPMYQAFIAQ